MVTGCRNCGGREGLVGGANSSVEQALSDQAAPMLTATLRQGSVQGSQHRDRAADPWGVEPGLLALFYQQAHRLLVLSLRSRALLQVIGR